MALVESGVVRRTDAFALFPLLTHCRLRLVPPEQVADLDVGVAIVAVFDFTSFAKERFRFVEEKYDSVVLGGGGDVPQILLRLSDLLADHLVQVDAVECCVEGRTSATRYAYLWYGHHML